MLASIYNFTIEQGARFLRPIKWDNPDGSGIDSTGLGYVPTMMAHQRGALVFDFMPYLTFNAATTTVPSTCQPQSLQRDRQ